MRTTKSRLRELTESTEYRKDFNELKKTILRLKSLRKSSFRFFKVDPAKSLEAGAVHRSGIPLKDVQSLLRKGNINDQWVMIPSAFEDFKARHNLKYFFDPSKPYPGGRLNPFDDKPLITRLPFDGGTRITMTVDISYPSKLLKKIFDMEIKSLKKMWELKPEKGATQYSESEIAEVKKLLGAGLKGIQIFKTMSPEYESFNPREDYIFVPEDEEVDGEKISYKTDFNRSAWRKYIRTTRLIKRAKGGKF